MLDLQRFIVSVHLYTQSHPIDHFFVISTYQKGDLYCIALEDGTVSKYPMQHIFRIVEGKTIVSK